MFSKRVNEPVKSILIDGVEYVRRDAVCKQCQKEMCNVESKINISKVLADFKLPEELTRRDSSAMPSRIKQRESSKNFTILGQRKQFQEPPESK